MDNKQQTSHIQKELKRWFNGNENLRLHVWNSRCEPEDLSFPLGAEEREMNGQYAPTTEACEYFRRHVQSDFNGTATIRLSVSGRIRIHKQAN